MAYNFFSRKFASSAVNNGFQCNLYFASYLIPLATPMLRPEHLSAISLEHEYKNLHQDKTEPTLNRFYL